MSRYICVDNICIPSDENDWEELVAFADAIAEQEPIEIIRCRECKHKYRTIFCGNIYYNCGKRTEHVEPDGYCDGGERE